MTKELKQWADDVSKAHDILAYGQSERALELLAETRNAMREALAQPAQEPVGKVTEVTANGFKCEFNKRLTAGTKLYTAQPQPKPLTHEQDFAIWEANFNHGSDAYFKARPELDTSQNRRIFYAGHRKAWLSKDCLTEQAHGIKENT